MNERTLLQSNPCSQAHVQDQTATTATSAVVPRLNFNVDEAATAIGVSPRMVRTLIARGEIRSLRIGRRRLVSVDALKRFVADREAAENVR